MVTPRRRRLASDPAPRTVLAGLIKPLLPRGWKIIPHQVAMDTLSTTVVMIKQMSIERLPAAPLGAHAIEFIVTVWSEVADTAGAEDDLDDAVDALLHAIDAAGIGWTKATKVGQGSLLGYDIPLTLSSTKKETGATP